MLKKTTKPNIEPFAFLFQACKRGAPPTYKNPLELEAGATGGDAHRGPAKGSNFRAESPKGAATGGDAQQGPAKGSDLRAEAIKGSRFCARTRQTFERVRTCREDSSRVRTFGHMLTKTLRGFALLAKTRKGLALLGTCSPKPRKGSHFGRGFAKGSHFWRRFAKGSHFWARPR